MSRSFNTTHLQRHTENLDQAHKLIAVIARRLDPVYTVHTTKCMSVSGLVYYTERSCRTFNIDDSIV